MDCFISYATEDIQVARRLRVELGSRGISAFLAADSTPAGAAWPAYISTAVRRAEIVVLLDSPHSRKSAWVQQEAGMAQASGSLVLPVSLDGRLEQLPGWLSGIQAVRCPCDESFEKNLESVVGEVCRRLCGAWEALPVSLQKPTTVGSEVLRSVLLDQFSGPEERMGAWSRQYDRYLRIYYGDSAIRSGVSQGASLTLTGMVTERLATLASGSSGWMADVTTAAVKRAEAFVVSCQDPVQGGFGRLASDYRVRSGPLLQLDLRHTCWAIRALLSIDAKAHSNRIDAALAWLARRAKRREESDRWCWTAAPLLALTRDSQLLQDRAWRDHSAVFQPIAEADLEANFDPRWNSWVKGEERGKEAWVSIDNALYVLYCLKESEGHSEIFAHQRREAIRGLLARTSVFYENGVSMRGLPLFTSDRPDPGPTAQLLEVMTDVDQARERRELTDFVVNRLRDRSVVGQTFSWHLSGAMTQRELRDEAITTDY